MATMLRPRTGDKAKPCTRPRSGNAFRDIFWAGIWACSSRGDQVAVDIASCEIQLVLYQAEKPTLWFCRRWSQNRATTGNAGTGGCHGETASAGGEEPGTTTLWRRGLARRGWCRAGVGGDRTGPAGPVGQSLERAGRGSWSCIKPPAPPTPNAVSRTSHRS